MTFDYSASGLPNNEKWQNAAALCHKWLTDNMSIFGPERIASFMKNQPVRAAQNIISNCPDHTEELVTLALLGPAKSDLLQDEVAARFIFGDRTVELLRYMAGMSAVKFDADMPKDAVRLFLVEGLSTMHDQLIGRARIDRHHETRWNILKQFETEFARVKGQNPGLDALFEDGLKKSRAALEALDNGPKKTPPKPPTL